MFHYPSGSPLEAATASRFNMAAKRARKEAGEGALQSVLHVGGISNVGLKKLLKELAQQPDIEVSHHGFQSAFHARL